MNKLIFIFFIFLGVSIDTVFSQSTGTSQPVYRIKDFELLLPEHKIQNSLYDSIDFVDSRNDTTNFGIVQLGAFNQEAKVIPKVPFSIQLQKVIQSITDSSALDGELLFQFRQLKFAEVTGPMSESGYCFFKAGLYSKVDSQYTQLATIDTILIIKSFDVTKSLLKEESKIITDFIANNLLKKGDNSRYYSHRDITKIDSTEKREIMVYNTEKYVEGLYYNYQSFSNQEPDKNIFVETKKSGKISRVKMNSGEENKLVKVKPKDVYAIVFNGQPYMATQYGFYPVTKKKDDFYFIGKIKVTASFGDVMLAQMMFGVVGGILAANANAFYEMKVDHTTGSFIRIREVGYE